MALLLIAAGSVCAQDAPTIDFFTPTGGPEGTEVRIVGTNLAIGAVSATIGDVEAEILSTSQTALVIRVAPGTTTGDLVVGTGDGAVTADERFTLSEILIDADPPETNLLLGESTALSATVSGTADTSVEWSVNGVPGGDAAVGYIVPGNPAVYTAPDSLPAGGPQVLVSVASVADPAVKATASVTLVDPAQGVPAIKLPHAEMADFDLDEEIWQPISRTRIMIALKEGATMGELAPQLAAMQAKVIGGLPEIDTLFVAIPDTGGLEPVKTAVATLGALPSVEVAAHDSLVSPAWLPEENDDEAWVDIGGGFVDGPIRGNWIWRVTPSGGNWGFEYANFPQAWNLYDYARKQARSVEVGVTDTVIHANHVDLNGIVTWQAGGFGDPEGHGTHVAATIGGKWDDKGINGASPFVTIASQPGTMGEWSTWGEWFTATGDLIYGQINGLLRNRPNLKVINSSQGYILLSGFQRGAKIDRSMPPDGDYTDPGDICVDNSVPPNGNCTDPGDVCTDRSGDGDCDDLRPDVNLEPKFRYEPDPPPAGPDKLIDAPSTPENNPVFQEFVKSQGWIARKAAQKYPNVIIVIAAGNERKTFAAAELHSNITPEAANRAAQWATVSAEFGDPFIWAAYNGASNILVAEALAKTDDRSIAVAERTGFSSIAENWRGDVFGFAAPGDDIFQAVPVWTPGLLGAPPVLTDGYQVKSGTSMAAPHIAGLVAYLYAVDPDLTVPQIMTILRNTSRSAPTPPPPAAPKVAPVIDAFSAVMEIDEVHKNNPSRRKWVKKALLNIDDGTIDGNDRTVEHDEKGTGLTPPDMRINMSDFRRLRDAYLLALNRVAHFNGDPDSTKRDLNGDGLRESGASENIYPRADFNGDGAISLLDFAVMADPDLWNDEQIDDTGMTPEELLAALDLLRVSGDIKLDADKVLEDPEVDTVKVTAKVELETGVYKSYSLTLTETDIKGTPEDKRKVLTLPADKPVRIWATAYKGSERKYFLLPPEAPQETQIHEGQDVELRLSKVNVQILPARIKASYDDSLVFDVKLTLEDTSVAVDTDYFDVSFTVPTTLGVITHGTDGFSLTTKSVPGDYEFQAVVQTPDGEVVNPSDEPQAIGAATVRTAIINEPGGLAFDEVGNMFVTDSQAGTVTVIPPGGAGLVILDGLDKPGDVEVDARGRSLIVAQAEGKVGRYFFGLTGTVKNAAGNRLAGAFVYVETPAGTIPGDATPENAFKTNEGGQFHVPDLLAPEVGGDPVEVVVTISYRGKDQAFPITLEPVGPTVEEFVLE